MRADRRRFTRLPNVVGLRRCRVILAGIAALGLVLVHGAVAAKTCFLTGGNERLQVCHDQQDEHVFLKPSPAQVSYNVQIIKRSAQLYTTVLHSEAEDLPGLLQRTGQLRAGDSIKVGTVDIDHNPAAALTAPAELPYKIWGSTTDQNSYLYYGIGHPNKNAKGLGGGGNPMVISANSSGDPYSYIFFLGVSDFFHYRHDDWRNVLLEARTKDFVHFDLLTGRSSWAPFTGGKDQVRPALVTSASGAGIVSNQPGPEWTNGLIGSVVLYKGTYYYFYTDQDPHNPALNHLYYRTATDLSVNGAWSDPVVVMDVAPQAMLRIAKARTMDRWVVTYNCLRAGTRISDVCLQYTDNMEITGRGGIASLQLYQPGPSGSSSYYLGLTGDDRSPHEGKSLKAQQDYITDLDGTLASPMPQTGAYKEDGFLTWMDWPITPGMSPFGATTYIARWTVTVPH